MKRSTLTLSILTALLVSACGGSSSNDEQTKDPTPPKVTPTQPSTPSTGRTPTTGKTEPKKEEASSSSSSDSTPPISSGSAPTGGKPIVIAGEPKKEIKPDPKPDEDENTEEDKPEDKPSDALSDIAKKLQESQTAFEMAQTEAALQKTRSEQAELKVNDLRAKISALLSTPLTTQELTVAALTKEVDAKKAKEINDLYDQYVAAEKAAADAAVTAEELQAAADAAEVTYKENKIASEVEELKKEWADKPQVLSVTEYVEAKTAAIKAQGQKELAEKKNRNLTDQRNVLGNAKKAKGRIAELNGKLAALKQLNSKDPAIKAKIDAAIKRTEEELADANERWEELHKEVYHANTDEKLAKEKFKAINGTELEKKADTAKNFGVAGGKGFAADKIFLGVQKAEKGASDGVWTITFDGMNEGVEVNNSSTVNTPIGSDSAYGKSGTVGTDNKPAAFRLPKTGAASIYGYFDDKFYSAGTVTTPAEMNKVPTAKVGEFSGTSFLVDTAGNKLVSEVKGKVRLGDKKEFEGDFQNFQKVGTNLEPINDGRLKNYVHFKADIDKNTFKPAAGTDAKVYGYFYGTNADEAGGLVEYEDVFHGSFGGEIKRQ